MIYGITEGFGLVLDAVPAPLVEMLRRIPAVIAAHGGLAGTLDPVAGRDDPDSQAVREDWKMVVEPELEEAFTGEVRVLIEDLEAAGPAHFDEADFDDEDEDEADDPDADEEDLDDDDDDFDGAESLLDGMFFRIVIKPERIEAWYGALNQVRLALEAAHGFGDERKVVADLPAWSEEKKRAWLLNTHYQRLQMLLLTCLEAQFGG